MIRLRFVTLGLELDRRNPRTPHFSASKTDAQQPHFHFFDELYDTVSVPKSGFTAGTILGYAVRYVL